MKPGKKNSYKSLSEIRIHDKKFKFYSLKKAEENGLGGISRLPKSLKVLLENLLRYEDDISVTKNQIEALKQWLIDKRSKTEIEQTWWLESMSMNFNLLSNSEHPMSSRILK